MENSQEKTGRMPDNETVDGTASQKTVPRTHFRRELVPLDEYAARQGISSDIVEQQGQLGVIQIRKFKGQKFVVDVPAEELSEFEAERPEEFTNAAVKHRQPASSKWITIGLTAGLIIIIVSVFWLYMDAKTRLDDLNAEYTSIQNRYNDLTVTTKSTKSLQEELAGAKVELARVQGKIVSSRAELDKIQADLNKARRNIDALQSELSGVQGQLSLSKVEIESVQNGLKESGNNLDTLNRQNTEPTAK